MMVCLFLTFQLDATHAKFMPFLIITVISALVILELVREFRKAKDEVEIKPEQSEAHIAAKSENTLSFYAFLWIFGFALAVFLVGFLIAIPLGVLMYLRFKSKKGWFTSIGMAVCLDLFIYVAFETALKVPLFRGLFFGGI